MAPTTPSNTLVGTTGNDILTSPGSVSTLVQGIPGNDTITLNLASDWAQGGSGNDRLQISTGLATFSGSIEAGEGDDRVFLTGNTGLTLNGAYVGLNAGNDTISFSSGVAFINSSIGGGQGNDSLSLTGNILTTSRVFAGKGADTVNLGNTTTFTATTLEGNEGQDRISASGLTTDAASYIGLGKGTDAITLATGVVGTVAGGGLNDTISFAPGGGVAGSVVIYGDANGVTTQGSGTGGAADGSDLISLTAGGFGGASVYGGGANDTILFAAAATGLVNAGYGADVIGSTGIANISGLTTIDGSNGQDTIRLDAIANSALVLGGAGNDSIYLVAASGTNNGGSVNGGAGNDTINLGAALVNVTAGITASYATINGGDGADVIVFNGTGAGFPALTGATGSTIGNVVYQSGDTIQLGTALNIATGVANWLNAGASTLYVAEALGFAATGNLNSGLSGLAIGSIGVFDNGDDLIIGINLAAGTSNMAIINVIGGDDAIKTTVVGRNVTFNSSNFGFTLAQSNGSLSITFS